jgi:hypothetical protein
MFPRLDLFGSRKQLKRTRNRLTRPMRVEQLECRRVLTTNNPLVSAALVASPVAGQQDLVITSSSPEASISVTESAGAITVTGNMQTYFDDTGALGTLQTNINNTGVTAQTFTPTPALHDIKITLRGDDSSVQVGSADVTVSPNTVTCTDLIISMPATTTSLQQTQDSIDSFCHLCIDVDTVSVAKNLTITTGATGTKATSEAALIDVTNTVVGPKGTLAITTNGNVDNMIGLSADTINSTLSVMANGTGDNIIVVVDTTVTGRSTVDAGGGDNTILFSDRYQETIESSLLTFVTTHSEFDCTFDSGANGTGSAIGGQFNDTQVQQLAADLETAADAVTSSGGEDFTSQYLTVQVGNGENIVDLENVALNAGNLVVIAGNGDNVIVLSEVNVDAATTNGTIGNATITVGNGNNLIAMISFEVTGYLTLTAGTGNNVILGTPNTVSVVYPAIQDFVANYPDDFYNYGSNSSDPAVLDIDNIIAQIIDTSDTYGVQAYKAIITTKDVSGNASIIDLSEGDVATTLTITMGNGDDGLFISQFAVGTQTNGNPANPANPPLNAGTATIKVGNGSDTIVVAGMGAEENTSSDSYYSGNPPLGEMNTFTLTTGSGADKVVISLDATGSNTDESTPPYSGQDYGIDPAVADYILGGGASNPDTLAAIDAELDNVTNNIEASTNPQSLNASHVTITIGTAATTASSDLTLSDIIISPVVPEKAQLNNRLTLTLLGTGTSDYVQYYNDTTDGASAFLTGTTNGDSTLDEHNDNNSGNNMFVHNFIVIPG